MFMKATAIMKTSRRSALIAALLLFTSHVLVAQTDYIGSPVNFSGHPRNLLLKGEEDALKKTIGGDKKWGKNQQTIIHDPDRILSVPPVKRTHIDLGLMGKPRETPSRR